MTACPFNFIASPKPEIDTLSFNYSFDNINSITTVLPSDVLNDGISINQTPKIPAILINLTGASSKPNMSISINGKTTTFNLYDAYITKKFPIIKKDNSYSFVIEGFSFQNISGEKILIFIPLNIISGDNKSLNPFTDMLNALVSDSNNINHSKSNISIDFNTFIPKELYYYYNYTDSRNTLYNIIAFDSSSLCYDTKLANLLATEIDNSEKYKKYTNDIGSKDTPTNTTPIYLSTSNPTNQDSLSSTFEDNIYIDCQPTDNLEKKDNYMHSILKESSSIIEQIEKFSPVILFIVFLSLFVMFILSFDKLKDYFSKLTEIKPKLIASV